MTIKITIPNTSSDTLTFGSANTPTAGQIAGIDSGSTNGQLAIYTTASGTSTERMRIDSSGNVGIGTASPGARLDVTNGSASANCIIKITNSGTWGAYMQGVTSNRTFSYGAFDSTNGFASGVWAVRDETAAAWRMMIDSSGNLLVGKTTSIGSGRMIVKSATTQHIGEWQVGTDGYGNLMYNAAGTQVGAINISVGSTAYVTTSDYRLKEDVVPMTGALAKVAQLKPITYKWKLDGSYSQGFIAHELQAIVPECVVGEKDALNEDGSINPQGIDTSFLVATLTAAIQEQQALITALTARITALENK